MTPIRGPWFRLVDEVPIDAFCFDSAVAARTQPLLVKGATRHWPAWERWSFEGLAAICEAAPVAPVARFQTGLTEQGNTRPAVFMPVAPFLRELGRTAAQLRGEAPALLSLDRRSALAPGERFHLDWSRMAFKPDRTYLQQWNMLEHFPALRRDFPLQRIWPGLRRTWEYVFIGPANTLAGMHYDFPNNWFCQLRGAKEFVLFPRDQARHIAVARKYDWGAKLSEIDVTRLGEQPEVLARFEKAEGVYARVEAGDALYVPKRTWHAVVALEPSVSIGIFGLTPLEIAIGGTIASAKDLLHRAHLYRWGNCTCHQAPRAPVPRL